MRTGGRWLVVGWLAAALILLALDGRLPIFLAWSTPGSLLVLGLRTLLCQQHAPSILDQPSRPLRYQVADELHQPLAAVIAAAEHDATTLFQQPALARPRTSRR